MKILQRGEVEMELKKLGDVEKKLKVIGEVERVEGGEDSDLYEDREEAGDSGWGGDGEGDNDREEGR